MESKQQQCKVSRWQILKQQLNNLPPAEFERLVEQTPDAVVLDVRTPEEYESRPLFPQALNINYLGDNFWEQIEQLDPEKTYFVYCRTGRRSVRTCTLMKNGGFRKIYHLDGGLSASGTK